MNAYTQADQPVVGEHGHVPKDSLQGVGHVAFEYLLHKLHQYDNSISREHERALRGLLWLAQGLTEGSIEGRFRFGLQCGMGKTTAVRAFLHAISKLGDSCPVIVACSQVEQLCALKRQLIAEDGVESARIGLMHSYKHDPSRAREGVNGFASEPSEGHDRQFLLVTHANVKAGRLKSWMRSRQDALMFFDESLVVSEALTVPLMNDSTDSLAYEAAGLEATAQTAPELREAAAWAQRTVSALINAAKSHDNSQVRIVDIPPVDSDLSARLRSLRVFATQQVPNLCELLRLAECGAQLRVLSNHERNRALIAYTITVPDELRNVIVLDASDPVRELVHFDRRMKRAEDAVPMLAEFAKRPGGMAGIKRNDRVRIFFANDAGGREAMRRHFIDGGASQPIEKLVRLIKANPDKKFLVFVYKDRAGEPRYAQAVQKALQRAGVDPEQGKAEGAQRVTVLTWGMETASNDYRNCDAVVLLGVIFQPQESIAGRFLGQVDDLRSPDLHSHLHGLVYAECVHSIYQAANRGAMRMADVIDGHTQARTCDLYIIHRDPELREKLDRVMPGAEWHPWREPGEDLKVPELAIRIAARLRRLEGDGVVSVSLRSLRTQLAEGAPSKSWQRARDRAIERSQWIVDRQCLIRPFGAVSAIA